MAESFNDNVPVAMARLEVSVGVKRRDRVVVSAGGGEALVGR